LTPASGKTMTRSWLTRAVPPPSRPVAPVPLQSLLTPLPPLLPPRPPTARRPHPFLWLVNTTAGLMALSVACATLLLGGAIAVYRVGPAQAPSSTPLQTTPAASQPENQSSQTKKESRGTATAHPNNGEPRLPAAGSRASKSRTIVLWRASEPPDLSALNPSDRQAIEEACSYAKQMESPEAYNGCLARELAARGHRGSDQH
jgi:hypothetical protein